MSYQLKVGHFDTKKSHIYNSEGLKIWPPAATQKGSFAHIVPRYSTEHMEPKTAKSRQTASSQEQPEFTPSQKHAALRMDEKD